MRPPPSHRLDPEARRGLFSAIAPDALVTSKVARRIVVLFVLCALVPVVCLAIVAFNQVSGELRAGSRRRMHESSKNIGMDIIDRLRRVDAEMLLVESLMVDGARAQDSPAAASLQARLRERFSHLALLTSRGESRTLLGPAWRPPPPTAEAWVHLNRGSAVLSPLTSRDGSPPSLLMRRAVRFEGASGVLAGVVAESFLFSQDMVPSSQALHVYDSSGALLFGSSDRGVSRELDAMARASRTTGDVTWQNQGRTYFGYGFMLPLAFDFLEPHWTIVVSEASDDVSAPISSARTAFVLVTVLSLWVVALLSLSQIRRSLVPLARLREATERIGAGDFDGLVDVRSGDEFEDLAHSLNTMSRELKRHFSTQTTVAELESAVLSSLDEEAIVRCTLDRLPQVLHCDVVCLVRLSAEDGVPARALLTRTRQDHAVETTSPPVEPADVQALLATPQPPVFERQQTRRPPYLSLLDLHPWMTCVAVPLVLATGPGGILLIAYEVPTVLGTEDLSQVRQIAGHMGVALSNARVVRALDRLNVGTLNALARTVDAKSPWTAGHSQRVTELAVEIGRAFGVSPQELDDLARGGLLHDIGKIAVPAAILNKPGPLTDEEFTLMKQHPRTGARILEPIAEYHRLIPIVLQHHEWVDGTGYPDGLAGEAISLGARILAVADVFDALTSDRPYRSALAPGAAAEIVKGLSGRQLEPGIVAAFLEVLARRTPARRDAAAA